MVTWFYLLLALAFAVLGVGLVPVLPAWLGALIWAAGVVCLALGTAAALDTADIEERGEA